ncbi:uncharacterized protein LY89DRAFT_759564 [Mollisia scopiformis]|uniref:Uncharacterized protein n=1 Tax=Mollisia scopiformis TaxID=149040 RepID=A0A194WRQ2_MOLSC|nr:uncharacterized protein LY89DRAFT_759564 [Mollisia scopiformis]KUJ10675.1 hypothetical protein LY89DRAFT_759564 [Mollisia scopiformis]
MRPQTSFLGCSILLSSFLAKSSFSHPLSERARLADCLYDLNPNFLDTGNTISTADIEACTTTALASRDLPRIDNGPPPALEDIIMKRGIQTTPLIVSGQSVAADPVPLNQSLQIRDSAPPNVGFFDQVSDGTEPILTNFLEPSNLENSWTGPICSTITSNFNPKVSGVTGIFNYNIQGTHKIAESLDHKNRFLNLLVTFTGTDPTLLPEYDIAAL